MSASKNNLRQSDPIHFTSNWCATIKMQDERIRNSVDQLHQQLDLNLYALALRNFIRAVEYTYKLNKDKDIECACDGFKKAIPGWLNVRDFLEHFDEYALGKGKLQKNGKATVYGPYYAEDERSDPSGKLVSKNYYLSFGEGNQIDIATTTNETVKLANIVVDKLSKA